MADLKTLLHKNVPPFEYLSESKVNRIKLSVIISVYNKADFLAKTLNSLVNQTLDPSLFEIIIIDDCSSDNSCDIVKDYIYKYPQHNWNLLRLARNSGSPGAPRNIGLKVAKGKYITIVDGDDWLALNGLEHLLSILEKTGDDYVVGMTIEHRDNNKQRIVAEQGSCDELRSVHPLAVNNIYQHLAPVARMFKKQVVDDNNLFFPELKYGEDKVFFMNLLAHCKKISTTGKIIYHVNRYSENKSLITLTNMLDKAENNFLVLQYVFSCFEADQSTKDAVVKRIFNFDLIHRMLDTKTFMKSEDITAIIKLFSETIALVENHGYDIYELCASDYQKLLCELFKQGKYKTMQKVVKWKKSKKEKEVILGSSKNKTMAYYNTQVEKARKIEIPLVAYAKMINNNKIYFNAYGEYAKKIRCVELRSRKDLSRKYRFKVKRRLGGRYICKVDKSLPAGKYSVLVLFDRYHHVNLQANYLKDNTSDKFYTTVKDNVGYKTK